MERLPKPQQRFPGRLGGVIARFSMYPPQSDPITSNHIKREEREALEEPAVVYPIHDTRPPRLEMPDGDDAA